MALTENLYTGNGTSVLFSFTFPYLLQSDVKVTLDGTATTAYTLANATQIQFTTAPATGVAIRIFRETASDNLSASFFSGASIKADDLNNNFLQNLFVTQESGFLVNQANTTSDEAKTTANTALSTANTASTNASSAVTTANTADANAAAAQTAATNAATSASSAQTSATAAQASATAAASDATAAASDAASAISTANSAVTTANTASSTASTALSTANTASTNASSAVTTANTANTNATAAQTAASNAATDASNAQASATNAQNSATAAAASAATSENVSDAFTATGTPATAITVDVPIDVANGVKLPTNANSYDQEGAIRYNTTLDKIEIRRGGGWTTAAGGANVNSTPPSDPTAGDVWYDHDNGRAYIYYNDGDSNQWVEMNPSWNGYVADNSVTSSKIVDGTIVNAAVNASAAIAGTKIDPNFGGQDITTTGSINVDTVSDNSHVKILTGSTPAERVRIAVDGQIGLSGENYGTVGQVITSNGSSNAPTWETIDSQTLAGVAASNYVRSDQGDSLTGTYTITSTSTDTPALKIFYDDFDEGLIIHRNHSTNNPAIVFENTTAQQGILHADNGVLKWRSGTGSVDGTIYTSTDGVALTSGATFTGDVRIDGDADLRVGDGASNERILIQKADNNVSDHIIFYNGTSRVGEIGCEDTTFLRLNQETDKPIYTPRYIRADSGFFVDGTSKGINGSGNFVGGTIAGASDYSTLLRSNAADTMTGMLTLYHAGDEMLRLQDTSSSGNPYVSWYQAGTRRAYIQYVDSGDKLFLKNDAANTGLELDGGTSGLKWKSGSSTWTVWHSGNDGSGSGLAADTLDGYHASTSRNSANTIPIRNSSGYMDLGWINTTSGSTTNTITKVYATYSGDNYIRYCTPNHLANAMSNVVKTAGSSMSGTLYRGSTTAGQSNTTTGWALGNGTLHASGSATPVCFNVNANTVLCSLRRSGSQKGRINVDTSRAYFYTSSDYRLKENVSLMTDGIERVKRLKPSYFRWIESQNSDEGFIAHELAEVCPGAVDGEKDAVDDSGNIKEQAAEYSYVTPVLTAAIKELIQKVETLEQQVATLTGA